MCLYPRLAPNPKYKPNKKNGYNPPQVKDPRVLWIPIACQNCIECRNKKANEWRTRLMEDLKQHTNGKFVTYTFSNEAIAHLYKDIKKSNGYETDNEIATLAIRRYLTKHIKQYKKSLRHWLVTELGHHGTENIHLHGIIWTNTNMKDIEALWSYGEKQTPYGYMWTGYIDEQTGEIQNYVNSATVNYIIKYIIKIDNDHKTFKSRILTTPGIGGQYHNSINARRNKYAGVRTNETYRTQTGNEIGIPIYWRNKIYSEDNREALWLQKLDKQERWVCGEKISVANSTKGYNALVEWHRKRSKALGYGDNNPNWKLKEYEAQIRNLNTQTRIQNAKKNTESP